MKKTLMVIAIVCFHYCCLSQQKDYKVVFDISSADSVSQKAVVREVEIIKTNNPDAKLEVVVYGQALNLVIKDKSMYAEGIEKLLAIKDVSFKVCSITMKRNNVDKSQLLANVEAVPDGIYEIISKQREGWGYIKVAH